MNRKSALLVGLLLAGALQGCATRQNPDPLEPWNRKVFGFNESLDANVLKPVAEGYKVVTPEPVRTAFTNFVSNIKDVWSTANLFLQGRFKDGTLGVIRFTVNSTLGLGGLIDIATPMQLYKSNEDFGQTLGVWGVKPGAYIVWPVLGSSTLRDSAGIPGDMYFSPSTLGTYPREENVLRALQIVNARANYLSATNLVDDVALDKYSFVRDAYLQRRQNLIYEGDPPEEDEMDDPSQPENVAPPAAGASEVGAATVPDAPVPVKTAQAESAPNPWAMFP
ncbi:MAG TPA: VacJ family lipoprotein [Aquabacterium sp.]|uniref:MlaA family lipoprotein n=1 Tax=Aquabacterium sp. TaxID=1872578 RepID=UPI002E346F08|nr:VacJ family lipoprotein [Aquabacterium sp.]HEX5357746.1 VacJ family lipoprotein [Aquabacterium sp.]